MIEIREIDRRDIDYLISQLNGFEKSKELKRGYLDAGKLLSWAGKSILRSRLKSGPSGVTGNLLRSITIRIKRNNAGLLVGFDRGLGGNHAHLVDAGTTDRYTKRGYYRGKMPANYFWTDTEAINSQQAVNALIQGIENAVNRVNNRN